MSRMVLLFQSKLPLGYVVSAFEILGSIDGECAITPDRWVWWVFAFALLD